MAAGPLALIGVTSGSLLGYALWEGRINTADQIRLRMRQGKKQVTERRDGHGFFDHLSVFPLSQGALDFTG